MRSGNINFLEPSGPLQACSGTAVPFRNTTIHTALFTFLVTQNTVHNILVASLWIRPTDALNSNFIGITTLHVSGSLSAHHQEFLAVYRLWYILCSSDDPLLPGAGWHCHPAPGSIRSSQLHKMYHSRYTAKNSWWWAERLPETCTVVMPIKLEFSASVWFYSQVICYDSRSDDLKILDLQLPESSVLRFNKNPEYFYV